MKKIIALLLALVLALSCFAACEKQPDPTDPPATNPPATDSKPTEPTETEPEDLFDGKHDIVEVTWCVRYNPQEDLDKVLDHLNKTILEPRYNLHLNVIMTPNAEYGQKMTLMMTGNEEWDICYTSNFTNVYENRVAMGAFYDLNELMDTKEWNDLMEVYPEGLYDWAMIDGHLYGLPNYQIMSSPTALYIQKELADKYDLKLKEGDVIENIVDSAEMMKFLENIRDKEPDYIPLIFNSQVVDGINYRVADQNYGLINLYASYKPDDSDYKVFYNHDDAAYKAWNIKNMAEKVEFAKKGFFQDDYLTTTDTSTNEKANRYAVLAGTGKPGGGADVSNRQGKEYIMVYMNGMEYYQGTPMTTCNAINYNSKNPLAALKMIQVMWTDLEVYNTFLAGIEGEHYKKVSENRMELIPDSGYNLTSWGWGCGNQFNRWLLPTEDDDVWEETKKMNENGLQDCTAGFAFNTEPVQSQISNLNTTEAEYKNWYWFCKDEAEITAKYEKYIAAQKTAGIDDVVAEAQKQLTAWAEANDKI